MPAPQDRAAHEPAPRGPRRPTPANWLVIGVATSVGAFFVWVGLGVAAFLADPAGPIEGRALWDLAERFLVLVMVTAPFVGAFTAWWQKRS